MHITGSNLFGQWPFKSLIIRDFQRVLIDEKIRTSFDYETANLVSINWSYNIYQDSGRFYISGSWQGKEEQLVQVDLPEDCNSEDTDYTLIGNDYNLFLVSKKNKILSIINLEDGKVTKKIKFDIETSHNNAANDDNDSIVKIVVTNNSMLSLTSRGNVYVGFLPCLVDIDHCVGKICDIECGYEHYILLSEAGRVYTWGNGRRLQLGHGDLTNQDSPTEVEALAGIKITKIKAGGWHSLALSEFGDLYAWGLNDVGQLGITKGINSENSKFEVQTYGLPTLVDLFDNHAEVSINVKDIACGTRHSAIVLEDDSIWTTGNNKYGQLGFSPESYPNVNSFKKTYFTCKTVNKVVCGPWSTVINTNKYLIFSFQMVIPRIIYYYTGNTKLLTLFHPLL